MRLIDADALKRLLDEQHEQLRRVYLSLSDDVDKSICKGELAAYATVKRAVDYAPTISPESLRPKGRWIMHDDEILGLSCECSVCHIETCGDSPYCPNCGADMRGEDDE